MSAAEFYGMTVGPPEGEATEPLAFIPLYIRWKRRRDTATKSKNAKTKIKTKDELQVISREISWYEEEARKSVSLALQYKLEIGKRLIRAKGLLKHGQFLRWAQNEFG